MPVPSHTNSTCKTLAEAFPNCIARDSYPFQKEKNNLNEEKKKTPTPQGKTHYLPKAQKTAKGRKHHRELHPQEKRGPASSGPSRSGSSCLRARWALTPGSAWTLGPGHPPRPGHPPAGLPRGLRASSPSGLSPLGASPPPFRPHACKPAPTCPTRTRGDPRTRSFPPPTPRGPSVSLQPGAANLSLERMGRG